MLGHHRHASEAPFQWRFAGWPNVARWLVPLSPSSTKTKTKEKKKRCQSWTPSDKTAWIRAWLSTFGEIRLHNKGKSRISLPKRLLWLLIKNCLDEAVHLSTKSMF